MKKILFIFLLLIIVYLIYKFAYTRHIDYLTMGDSLSKGLDSNNAEKYGYSDYLYNYLNKKYEIHSYNSKWTDKNYRITDLINIINKNEKKDGTTINEDLRKSDILTLSIGLSEIYYHLQSDKTNIYKRIDEIMNDMDKLLNLISKYNYNDVYILDYYNITSKNQDVFNYANHKLKRIVKKYDFEVIEISDELNNSKEYFDNNNSFNPNIKGYYEIYKKIVDKIENN